MALPPGFLDELRSRVSIADVVGRKVTWDRRKSNQSRGDWWAPCPFHQEKTPSFHVEDRKGFYHCFGCGASGDAIKFLTEAENMGFMEAVETLARDVGMTMPAPDPQAQEKARAQAGLTEIMDAAVAFYRRALAGAGAQGARAYLDRRGLAPATLERFEIGFAPPGRRTLFEHLKSQGVAPDRIVACGLAKAPDDGGVPYDRFRDRIMFPIRDPRGRCIAFGGRALSADALAKYLNSPETELFDKSRTLYNYGPARAAAGKGAPLIVAEGYMDVIALVAAGFEGAVAPLGTAMTEAQRDLLWRAAPEPVIALDGDGAGLRAARRAAHLALPGLAPGRTLRVALLPEGQDPDDLIRAGGATAMQKVIDNAAPLVDVLWQEATEGRRLDTPDDRAALEARLAATAAKIGDEMVRGHYRRAFRDRQWAATRPARGTGGRRGPRGVTYAPPTARARASGLADASPERLAAMREAAVLAMAIATPGALDAVGDRIAEMAFRDPDHAAMRDALLAWHAAPHGSARDAVAAAVGPQGLETLFALPHIAVNSVVRRPGDVDTATVALTEELNKLTGQYGLEAEIRETTDEVSGFSDDGARATWRLAQAVEACNSARRHTGEDRRQFETLPNGVRVPSEERSALDRVLREIGFGNRDTESPPGK